MKIDKISGQSILLQEMCQMAEKLNLVKDKKNGCHICLNIDESAEFMSGYILMSVDTCFFFNKDRDFFLQNFQKIKSDYSIET